MSEVPLYVLLCLLSETLHTKRFLLHTDAEEAARSYLHYMLTRTLLHADANGRVSAVFRVGDADPERFFTAC